MTSELRIGVPLLPDPGRLAELVAGVLDRGRLTNSGPLHEQLQGEVAALLDVPGPVLTSSGTTALMMALRLMDLPAGSEVVTTPLTFAATTTVLDWMGLRPVFADVDPATLTLDPDSVRAAVGPRTSAILGVHIYGTACDTAALGEVAREHGLALLYDACHAFGVTVDGRGIGTYGDASAFSLHATKLLNTGEGGVVTTPHGRDTERLARLRNFGLVGDTPAGPGINGKLPEISAAVGLAMLDRLAAERKARAALRSCYDEIVDRSPAVTRQPDQPGVSAPEIFYAIRVPEGRRTALLGALTEAGIRTRAYFPLLCGPGTAHPDAAIVTAKERPAAPAASAEVVCLPFHSGVGDRHLELLESLLGRI